MYLEDRILYIVGGVVIVLLIRLIRVGIANNRLERELGILKEKVKHKTALLSKLDDEFAVSKQVTEALKSELLQRNDLIKTVEEKLHIKESEFSQLKSEHFNVKAELYKFRLNPHSFKNTLSSIKSVATKTHNLVRNLSGVLDYMLYDSNGTFVTLEEELEFALEYFNLYKQKCLGSNNYSFVITDNVTDISEDLKVPPLITASFIENAFKHTDTNDPKSDIQIFIDIFKPRTLLFSAKNTFREDHVDEKGGVGLTDFRDRLELLYPGQYDYQNSVNGKWYECYLKINLE